MNRREVLQKFLVGSTVLALVPSVLDSCSKDATMNDPTNPGGTNTTGKNIVLDLSLAENSSLIKAGSSKIVQNILIINTGTKFVALSAICTHQGCTVGYNPVANDIECPCHGSVYSTSGSVTNGPAPSPLHSYQVTQTDNIITINL
jgi:cytochrome b6-f complex iron-sulfur subunit